MGNLLDGCSRVSMEEEALAESKGGEGLKKLQRCNALRVEEELQPTVGEEQQKRKKAKRVTFCDEIIICGADDDGKMEKKREYCSSSNGEGRGGEKGVLCRVKIVLPKEEAAKLVGRCHGEGTTLDQVLAEIRGMQKMKPSSVLDQPPLESIAA